MRVKLFSLITAVFISSALFATEPRLETIAASGGSNLFLSYLSIGLLADTFPKEVYEKKQTISLLTSVVEQAKIQKDYLDKLIKLKDVSKDDAAYFKKMIDSYTLLMEEGNHLLEYMNTGDEASLKAYENSREKARVLISGILGFDK